MTLESLLADIEAFCELANISSTEFGRRAVNDPSFVGDLRQGRMPGLRLVNKVVDYIAKNTTRRPSTTQEARVP